MNELATIDIQNGDLTALYSVLNSGPRLADMRLNREPSIEYNDKNYTVEVPGVKIDNTDFDVVYGTDVSMRIFLDTMQTSVFDQEKGEYSNISQHFKEFDQLALDWYGGDKCGWRPSREREKIRASDPITYANLSKVKLSRNLFGLVTLSDAKTPEGKSIKVVDLPVRIRLGPSNFYEISQVMGKMIRQQCMPIHHDVKFKYRIEKKGSNRFIVLNYDPILSKKHEVTAEDKETLQNFFDLIKIENEKVTEKMRENMNTTLKEDFSDVVDAA